MLGGGDQEDPGGGEPGRLMDCHNWAGDTLEDSQVLLETVVHVCNVMLFHSNTSFINYVSQTKLMKLLMGELPDAKELGITDEQY